MGVDVSRAGFGCSPLEDEGPLLDVGSLPLWPCASDTFTRWSLGSTWGTASGSTGWNPLSMASTSSTSSSSGMLARSCRYSCSSRRSFRSSEVSCSLSRKFSACTLSTCAAGGLRVGAGAGAGVGVGVGVAVAVGVGGGAGVGVGGLRVGGPRGVRGRAAEGGRGRRAGSSGTWEGGVARGGQCVGGKGEGWAPQSVCSPGGGFWGRAFGVAGEIGSAMVRGISCTERNEPEIIATVFVVQWPLPSIAQRWSPWSLSEISSAPRDLRGIEQCTPKAQ